MTSFTCNKTFVTRYYTSRIRILLDTTPTNTNHESHVSRLHPMLNTHLRGPVRARRDHIILIFKLPAFCEIAINVLYRVLKSLSVCFVLFGNDMFAMTNNWWRKLEQKINNVVGICSESYNCVFMIVVYF